MKNSFIKWGRVFFIFAFCCFYLSPAFCWEKLYGTESQAMGYSAQQTNDGGYIITGYTNSYGEGDYDVLVIKADSAGNCVWSRIYGGVLADTGQSIELTADGGYIIAGSTASFGAGNQDVYLFKIDSNGNTLWTRTYGGSGLDRALEVNGTSAGGCIITGEMFFIGTV